MEPGVSTRTGSAARRALHGRGRRRIAASLAAVTVAAGVLSACSDAGSEPPLTTTPSESASSASASPTVEPTPLTFGVFGPPAERAAYREVVEAWNAKRPDAPVEIVGATDSDELVSRLEDGAPVPDVFLTARRDLGYLRENDLTQPVGKLLDTAERDVDLGDGYPIDAVQAFAGDDDLQCMPYGYSPMVIYYNRKLVDFTRMERRGLDVPSSHASWTFAEFEAAARFASRPATKNAAGVYIEPTVRGLAPFVYSGGGQVFDDQENPTSMAFSSEESIDALRTTLELLRDPLVSLTDKQLRRAPALTWFKRGKLGMIAGYRSLTPELRRAPGLDFDVMAMPTIDEPKTIGEVTGLCMSADAADADLAADFIYQLISDESVGTVADAGYMVPASLAVSTSDDFLQPDQKPRSASVFNATVRYIELPPVLDVDGDLEDAVGADIQELFSMGVLDLERVTTRIDADSREVLDPEAASGGASAGSSEGR